MTSSGGAIRIPTDEEEKRRDEAAESLETEVRKQRRHMRLVLPQKRLARLLRNVAVLEAPNKSPQLMYQVYPY